MGLIGRLVVGFFLLAAGAVGYALYQSAKPPEGSVEEFLRRPRPAGKRVAVIFGASTIHGRIGIDALPAVRERLPGWEVVNAGHNGDTCSELLARVDRVLACQADVVVVQTGGNDAIRGRSVADFERDLTALVDRLQASGAQVVLCSFQVAGDDLATPVNRRLGEYAELQHALAAERNLGYLALRERMAAELEGQPGGRASEGNPGMVAISILERHLLRRSLDEQSRRRGFSFNPDGQHLNTRGAAMLTDVIIEYLETQA